MCTSSIVARKEANEHLPCSRTTTAAGVETLFRSLGANPTSSQAAKTDPTRQVKSRQPTSTTSSINLTCKNSSSTGVRPGVPTCYSSCPVLLVHRRAFSQELLLGTFFLFCSKGMYCCCKTSGNPTQVTYLQTQQLFLFEMRRVGHRADGHAVRAPPHIIPHAVSVRIASCLDAGDRRLATMSLCNFLEDLEG